MRKSNFLSRRLGPAAGLVVLVTTVLGVGCTAARNPVQGYETVSPATELSMPHASGRDSASYSPDQVDRGRYMVKLLGCGICHTDGALVGKPDYTLSLAGSKTGIAYSSPLEERNPGVIYPSNITPDPETGIGGWSESEIVRLLRSGEANHNRQLLAIMPWPTYASLTDADALAIAVYLRSLAPVEHKVPSNVSPGQKASAPYVHFGVYRSEP